MAFNSELPLRDLPLRDLANAAGQLGAIVRAAATSPIAWLEPIATGFSNAGLQAAGNRLIEPQIASDAPVLRTTTPAVHQAAETAPARQRPAVVPLHRPAGPPV